MAAEENRCIFETVNFQSFGRVLFGLLRLGSRCNATRKCSFTGADCDIEYVKDKENPVAANFCLLFGPGISLLKDARDSRKEKLLNHEEKALLQLKEYLRKLDYHAGSLKRVLLRQQPKRKDQMIAVLIEHLLGELAPGYSRVMEGKEGRKPCPCGCEKKPNHCSNGIGHEDVWHGDIDIICGVPESECIATTVVPELSSPTESDTFYNSSGSLSPIKRPRTEDEHSTDGETIDEEEVLTSVEDQAIAQIIVFSLLQSQKHPNSPHHLIPNIVLSPTRFRIYMYDAESDILLGSISLPLFDHKCETLQTESVIILWMVLHYHIFCTGINVDALTSDFKKIDIRSHFRQIAEDKWDVYSKSLKENVNYFPPVKKRIPVTFDTYWRAKELTYRVTDN